MSELHLFDVSQYMFIGDRNLQLMRGMTNIAGRSYARVLPCWGIAALLEAIRMYGKKGDLVFCVDSPPTYKRELYSRLFPDGAGYKGNRPKKPEEIVVQKKMIVELLELLKCQVICKTSYEADDLIASVVEEYASSYDKVYIHSTDSDLFYLVSENVEVVPLLHKGKYVNMSNWETTVNKDYTLKYNSITLFKMCRGEPSDNIPAVESSVMQKIYDSLDVNKSYMWGNNDLMRRVIACIVGEGDIRTLGIFDLITPRVTEVELYEMQMDMDLFNSALSIFQCKSSTGQFKQESIVLENLIDKYISMYMDMKYL